MLEEQEAKKAEKWRKKWEAVFPPPDPVAPIETDISGLYGVWRPDRREEARAMELFGAPPRYVEAALAPSKLELTTGMYFSPTKMEDLLNGYTSNEYEILGCEHKGTRLIIQVMATYYNGDRAKVTYEFWYDGKRLVQTIENNVVVLLRGEDSYRKGEKPPRPKWMDEKDARKKAQAALKKGSTEDAG